MKMKSFIQFILVSSTFIITINCGPFDDGKYVPQKYNINDDGRYYRPNDEGKYVHTDEGRYTYVYRQGPDGIYRYVHQRGPDDDGDYRYRHVVGPDGGVGGNGGFGGDGGFGGNGGYGPNGPNGPNGPGGPKGPGGPPGPSPNHIESDRKTYAARYPYIDKVIKSLVDQYTSSDFLASEGSSNHYSKVFAGEEVALKCHYLSPTNDTNQAEFVTQYPPSMKVEEGQRQGSFYNFKGTQVLNTVNNSLKTKLKLDYEVFVRVAEVVN